MVAYNLRVEKEDTFWVKIYLSGPINVIEQVCRKYCLEIGLCVTIEPTKFIYAGGEELGCVVGLINYPRFPSSIEEISGKAEKLAYELLRETHQQSVLLMSPFVTKWITTRNEI